ncbi:tetratricopeptide repeat protein [Pleionea sp. CnH1-48]|uniref:tetratricopeptide repeat protein n=1 Tax=Pleionea sp. CnH1-48 TaxID=2954494 RepID=UPI002096C1AB|nr:tetratricopeptide repeat protein [Pleionea sp. CnH1-48]MCO7227000.1 tetratricopeptide repeat protein [Pleionea sp. CnH1-48]
MSAKTQTEEFDTDAMFAKVEKIREAMEAGKPLSEALDIPEDQAEGMYFNGYSLYQMKKYKESIVFFSLLAFLDMTNPRYLSALAANLQMLDDHEAALPLWKKLTEIDSNDKVHAIRLAECLVALGQYEEALAALQEAKECTKFETCDPTVKQKLEQMLNLISIKTSK